MSRPMRAPHPIDHQGARLMRWLSTTMAASLALALVTAGAPGARAPGQAADPHHQATQLQAPQPPAAARDQTGMGAEATMPMMAQMMSMMRMMARGGADPFAGLPLTRIEGRLAFVKAELAITEAQMPQWNAAVAAIRTAAAKLLAGARELQQAPAPTTALEQMERLERIDTLLLEAIRACRTASAPLYAVLDDAQKRTADELMLGVMGFGPTGMAM
jgi:LTXXQ motif family protein